MRQLRKKRVTQASINTASLPDIVFMLLFFFMSVTVLRVQMTELELQLPKATESAKVKRSALISYIYVAPAPDQQPDEKDFIVQLNNDIIELQKLPKAIKALQAEVSEDKRAQFRCLIKADEQIKMRAIDQVKSALREAEQYKITYASLKHK